MLSTLLSSFIIQAEASKEDEKEQKNPGVSEAGEGDDNKEEGGAAEGGTAEQEEEEPEDLHPTLREECSNSAQCVGFKKHFEHCQEKVQAGEGFKGEDCVEEMFHMMHCADNCVAPTLFSKLR